LRVKASIEVLLQHDMLGTIPTELFRNCCAKGISCNTRKTAWRVVWPSTSRPYPSQHSPQSPCRELPKQKLLQPGGRQRTRVIKGETNRASTHSCFPIRHAVQGLPAKYISHVRSIRTSGGTHEPLSRPAPLLDCEPEIRQRGGQLDPIQAVSRHPSRWHGEPALENWAQRPRSKASRSPAFDMPSVPSPGVAPWRQSHIDATRISPRDRPAAHRSTRPPRPGQVPRARRNARA
jgi:hypothetical protein